MVSLPCIVSVVVMHPDLFVDHATVYIVYLFTSLVTYLLVTHASCIAADVG